MKVLFWCKNIDCILKGTSQVAGIQVQMLAWADVFYRNGWECFSLSSQNFDGIINNIHFIPYCTKSWVQTLRLAIINEIYSICKILKSIKPDLVIVRGASRSLFMLSPVCRKFGIKLVFFAASDPDFVLGKEVFSNKVNKLLYEKSIRHIDSFVVQNTFQKQKLMENYGKDSLMLFNIWNGMPCDKAKNKVYDAVWVSNLRHLKRPEWFIALAKQYPERSFAMAGGSKDKSYYDEISQLADKLANFRFFGALPYDAVTRLVSESRLLVCTSEFEGFPNTFLQAWSESVPVISTVDPSNVIVENHLGKVIESEADLLNVFPEILAESGSYASDIDSYFMSNHNADISYGKLMRFLVIN